MMGVMEKVWPDLPHSSPVLVYLILLAYIMLRPKAFCSVQLLHVKCPVAGEWEYHVYVSVS